MKQHGNDVRILKGRAPFYVVFFKAETFTRFSEGKAAFLKAKAGCSKGREAFLKGDASPPPLCISRSALPFRKAALPFRKAAFPSEKRGKVSALRKTTLKGALPSRKRTSFSCCFMLFHVVPHQVR